MGKATNEIKNILRGKFLVEGKEATKNWTFIAFLFVLGVIMITSSHNADNKVHQIAKLNEEVNELKSQFVDVRSQLQKVKLESSLLNKLKSKGLKQPEKPPQKIKVIIKE
ncbi:S-adenosyl-methyltransferase [Capnocytophaga cynodegmi]|uniref:S-adenosyl-methyltransferase n=1 Tax=Capnocytophaga cynodegmi TaxID=28189 RepID=A0A250E4W4_9FLAO|nr:FtsL-like putative cell division protein [Capnocytophaga cynodegmi]ATA67902.1 S-adenosyl-methyltransferase [Capnocytophaga cynodegmi]